MSASYTSKFCVYFIPLGGIGATKFMIYPRPPTPEDSLPLYQHDTEPIQGASSDVKIHIGLVVSALRPGSVRIRCLASRALKIAASVVPKGVLVLRVVEVNAALFRRQLNLFPYFVDFVFPGQCHRCSFLGLRYFAAA